MEKINIAGFNKNSITDGPGLRFVVFCQGCVHHCEGCHNPQTHEFGTGTDYTVEEIYNMVKQNPIAKGVTFSGGEPFCQPAGFLALARLLKAEGYELASYSGFTIEEIMADKDSDRYKLLENLDILVDGKFILEQMSFDLKFKGSANQRTLDVPESIKQGKAVLSTSQRWV
ncbi:MAG: anaerobic ribonucleoside-triphosphate reductase activating protein [Oscillospiraceae bacterium]